MMTEDEARERWCPFVRIRDETCTTVNRSQLIVDKPACCASECMAWRWDEYPDQGEPQTGFCGLAGKP